MYDDRSLDRFMKHTIRSLHAGLVGKRRALRDLLVEAEPATVTVEGEAYHYDPEELRRWAGAATPEEGARLRLPVILRFDLDLADTCLIDDEVGGEVLRRLEGFGRAYAFREGRMHLPYSLGLELLMKYPTTLQRMFLG